MSYNQTIINKYFIPLILTAIDDKNKKEIEYLVNENNIGKNNDELDIVYELFKKFLLNPERFQFIVESCTSYMNISSRFVNELMKNDNKELLEILFKYHLKFFDSEFIINLLINSKNKTPLSDVNLCQQINNNKYKLSTELNYDKIYNYSSSLYLFKACENGNESQVKYLIEHGADINIRIKDNITPFLKACESGNINLVKYLVKLGANIKIEDIYHNTPIFYACSSGNDHLVKYLVKRGANINKTNIENETPLFNACLSGNIHLVKYLVKCGIDINKENKRGITPLFYACSKKHEDVIKYLVELGASINDSGKTLLSVVEWKTKL